MSPEAAGVAGIVMLLALFLLRVPIAFAMNQPTSRITRNAMNFGTNSTTECHMSDHDELRLLVMSCCPLRRKRNGSDLPTVSANQTTHAHFPSDTGPGDAAFGTPCPALRRSIG